MKLLAIIIFLLSYFFIVTSQNITDAANCNTDEIVRCNYTPGCFWYAGYGNEDEKCVESYNMKSLETCVERSAPLDGSYCYNDMECNESTKKCYKNPTSNDDSSAEVFSCNGYPLGDGILYACSSGFGCDFGDGNKWEPSTYNSGTTTCGVNADCCYREINNPAPTSPGTGTVVPTAVSRDSDPPSTIICGPPDHVCDTEAGRPDGYTYVDNEANRAELDAACGGGDRYCWTKSTTVATTTPGTESETQTPPTSPRYPCDGHGSQYKEYLGEFCVDTNGTEHKWNATDAAVCKFANYTYIDKYRCVDDFIHSFAPAVSTLPGGVSPCARSPWCKNATTTTPSTTPSVTATQPSDCSMANYGNWKSGCECPDINGCATGYVCYPEAENGSSTTGPFYCASYNIYGTVNYWCAATGQEISTAEKHLCKSPTTTATKTPTPTPPDLSYQADCPDDGFNACILGTACPDGYQQNDIGFGGTNGNKVCTEFEGGQQSTCCRRITGSSAPVVTSAATPTPAASQVLTCAGNASEHCQAGLDGTQNETCIPNWTNVGKRNCTLNTTCCRQN